MQAEKCLFTTLNFAMTLTNEKRYLTQYMDTLGDNIHKYAHVKEKSHVRCIIPGKTVYKVHPEKKYTEPRDKDPNMISP